MTFRLKVLFVVLIPLVPATIIFALGNGFGLPGTASMIMIAQCVVQGSFFVGLVVRTLFPNKTAACSLTARSPRHRIVSKPPQVLVSGICLVSPQAPQVFKEPVVSGYLRG
jgi:hypothetical protein